MDRYTEEYILQVQGINGVKLVSRDSIPYERANKARRNAEAPLKEGDRRQSLGNRLNDYMISGEGRSPAIVRELQSDFPGMKKYALIDMRDVYGEQPQGKIKKAMSEFWGRIIGKQDNIPYEEICFLYSEGLDIEKMISDPAYAEMLIDLLDEERINKLRGEQNDCYIGTIQANKEGYSKMIRPNPQAVIEEIRTERARQQAQQQVKLQEEHERVLKKVHQNIQTENTIQFVRGLSPEQAEIAMDILYHALGKETYVRIQESIVKRDKEGTTMEEQLIASGDYIPFDGEEPEV